MERELRELKKRMWIRSIDESKYAICLVLAIAIIFSWRIYRSTERVIESDKLLGVLVGIHQIQDDIGSSKTKLSIKLNNGEYVVVIAPDNTPIKNNAGVEIIRGKTDQGSIQYKFNGYRETK